METMSELYDIKEILQVTFTISFKLIERYQWEYPSSTEILKYAIYQKHNSCGVQNTIEFVTKN